MLAYKPIRLGQAWSDLTGGLTGNLAKQIVVEAEPIVRRVVRDERNKFAEALMGAIPFFALSAMAYVGTRYLVPDDRKQAKGIGYIASAGSALVGGGWAASVLAEKAPTPPPVEATSAGKTAEALAQSTARAIVLEAEPKVRAIISEERQRLADAGKATLPFVALSGATLLATIFLVDKSNSKLKAAGYTGTALLLGLGSWIGLNKIKEEAAA